MCKGSDEVGRIVSSYDVVRQELVSGSGTDIPHHLSRISENHTRFSTFFLNIRFVFVFFIEIFNTFKYGVRVIWTRDIQNAYTALSMKLLFPLVAICLRVLFSSSDFDRISFNKLWRLKCVYMNIQTCKHLHGSQYLTSTCCIIELSTIDDL